MAKNYAINIYLAKLIEKVTFNSDQVRIYIVSTKQHRFFQHITLFSLACFLEKKSKHQLTSEFLMIEIEKGKCTSLV